MDQDKIKRMFGSKRSLCVSETPVSESNQNNIRIAATPHYQKEGAPNNKLEKNVAKFYSEKELTPIQGSWDFQKNSSVLETSLTDYLAEERIKDRQLESGIKQISSPALPHQSTMSLNDLKSQAGVYNDYTLSSHFDYSPAIENSEHQQQDNSTGEEVPYNMSYLPEDTQALPGTKGYFLFTRLASRAFMLFISILALPLFALAGLYFLQGPQGEQWVTVKSHMTHFVRYAQGSEKSLFKTIPHLSSSPNINSNHRVSSRNSTIKQHVTRRSNIDGQTIAKSGSFSDIPLMIKVSQTDLSSKVRVKISGIPKNASLTKGDYMAAGVWMVSIADIPDLSMRVTGALKHEVQLTASFLQNGGQVVELASYKIPKNFQNSNFALNNQGAPQTDHTNKNLIQMAGIDKTRTRHMNLSSRHMGQKIPKLNKVSTDQTSLKGRNNKADKKATTSSVRIHPVYEQQQLNRASIYLAKSDFKTAREILEKTARAGSARAATALARSYDPKFLLKIKVHGIKPNLDHAKYWYQQAVKLGNASALNRLSQLK